MVLIEKQADKAVVWVYSYIGSYEFNGEVVLRLLLELADFPTILFHLHSYGGDVFEGNVIYNQIASAKQRTELQIDGVCASMATVISQAFDKISIVENGYMMIHAPSGGAYGNAAALENMAVLLRSMEGQFKKDYSRRSGKPEEDTAVWMDGQDHWMTPAELLAAGLVDEIVPSVVESPDTLTLETVSALGANAVYSRFSASLEQAAQPKAQNSTMNKQQLIDKYKLSGVTKDTPDEQFQTVLEAKIDELSGKAEQADAAQVTVDEAIEAQVEAAFKAQKITAEDKVTFKNIGRTAGVKALATALGAIKPYQSISASLGNDQGKGADAGGQTGWDWDRYQKENPTALASMADSNPEQFKKLYKDKYSVEPK